MRDVDRLLGGRYHISDFRSAEDIECEGQPVTGLHGQDLVLDVRVEEYPVERSVSFSAFGTPVDCDQLLAVPKKKLTAGIGG